MFRQFIFLLVVLTVSSCSSEQLNEVDQTDVKNESHQIDTLVVSNNKWISETFYPNVEFTENNSLIIEFNGQCQYEYTIYPGLNMDLILYEKNEDCLTDIPFGETFGLEKYPELGNTFIQYWIDGDTLRFEFLYPEWIDSLNATGHDYPYFSNKYVKKK
ncbi:MAG: hypothetical protein H6600_03145 [Flavobacteriales bacterium]|nr:hypothetical protein [Flavobacteriales bacterium]